MGELFGSELALAPETFPDSHELPSQDVLVMYNPTAHWVTGTPRKEAPVIGWQHASKASGKDPTVYSTVGDYKVWMKNADKDWRGIWTKSIPGVDTSGAVEWPSEASWAFLDSTTFGIVTPEAPAIPFDLRQALDDDDPENRRQARETLTSLVKRLSPDDIAAVVTAMPNSSYRYALGVAEALAASDQGWRSSNPERTLGILDSTARRQGDAALSEAIARARDKRVQ
jgi:hypothetical protein